MAFDDIFTRTPARSDTPVPFHRPRTAAPVTWLAAAVMLLAAAALLVQKRRGRRAGSPVLCAPSRQTPIRFLCSCRPALLHVSPPLVARPVSRRPGLLRSRNISFGAGLFSCRPQTGHMGRAKARWI